MLILRGHTGPVRCLAYSPDGRTLTSGSDDKTIKLWEPEGGQATFTLHGHTSAVRTLALSADGNWLVSGGEGGEFPGDGST